jgi:VIT1/CCC1 family predicted Fe2+/Mn2+ transporter
MTLQTEPPAVDVRVDQVPAQRAPTLVVANSAAAGHALATPVEPLDRFSRRAYASAIAGLAIAAAAAVVLRHRMPLDSRSDWLITCLVVLGATMFAGGATTGSIRPRSHLGGEQ